MATFEAEGGSKATTKKGGIFKSISGAQARTPAADGPDVRDSAQHLNYVVMTAAVQLQLGGSGKFVAATATAEGGVLKFHKIAESEPDIGLPMTDFKVSTVNAQRSGQPFCLKINADAKYVVSFADEDTMRNWLIGLQDRISANLDFSAPKDIAQTGGENYPNMIFIPLKTVTQMIPAYEFALFIFLLCIFMSNLGTQHFDQDFATTDGLKGMTGMTAFYKVSTVDDYIAWWPVLLSALKRWSAEREGWMDPTLSAMARSEKLKRVCDLQSGCNDIDFDDIDPNRGAELLGLPYITQTQRAIFDGDGKKVETPRAFNASGAHGCPWALERPSDEQLRAFDMPNGTLACYAPTKGSPYDGHDEYFVRHMQGIINGSIRWDPGNWINADTVELSHQLVLYFPATRRYAKVIISVNIDPAGRVGQTSVDGSYPAFEVFEPFIWEADPRSTVLELCFYCLIVKLFIGEIFEIWECICFQEQLLPLQVLTASLDLQLHEIMHHHEKANQVYDPRDPKTQKAFEFPDLDDLKEFMNGAVQELEDGRDALVEELAGLKAEMGELRGQQIKGADYEKLRGRMAELQLKLIKADMDVRSEECVAEMASIMQLAVMWANDWSTDFPANYLSELGDDAEIGEDGLDAFRDVNWIDVGRAYLKWCAEVGHDHDIKDEGSITDLLEQLTFKITHPFAKSASANKVAYTAQYRHFEKLAPLLDYLEMLHDVLSLHTRLVTSRQMKHWAGPRGVQIGSTVSGAFQRAIREYNETGKRLKKEMEVFPDEIADGFSEPDSLKAETIKIKAKGLLRQVKVGVETCGMLGLFFPGSQLWELQRKNRLASKYNKSAAFCTSVKSFGVNGSVVSDSAMYIYARPSDVLLDGENAVETLNPLETTASTDADDASASAAAAPPPRFMNTVRETGTPGWRTWIPKGAELLVNWDGQFVVPRDKIHQWKRRSVIYPTYLWLRCGIATYLGDTWNTMEFISSLSFMYSFYSKVRMLQLESQLDAEREAVQAGLQDGMPQLEEFETLSYWFMKCLVVNSMLMWLKLFKYIGVIPQMGVLLTVLGKAGPSVLIFSIVAMVPCVGISLSYHVAFGAVLKNYSEMGLSLNSVMRMAVGDFDFDEIYGEHPLMSLLLFWLSSLLIVFVLINIFIAIIMAAYDSVLSMNPDAADASNFPSMVMMQVTRIVAAALGQSIKEDDEEGVNVHVLQNSMDRIDDEDYWDIFEGYFHLPSSDSEEEEEEEADDGDDIDKSVALSSGGDAGSSVTLEQFKRLSADVAGIKSTQARFQKEVTSQLDDIKQLLTVALSSK